MNTDDPIQQLPFDSPGIVQTPEHSRLATYRPEALMGMPMRYHDWERLKRAIRRSMIGGEKWWKEFALLFLGTAIGLALSVVIPSVSGTTPPDQKATWVSAGIFVFGFVLCVCGHYSTAARDKLTAAGILELMDDVEAQFTKPARY
jgi:hypothetical protein